MFKQGDRVRVARLYKGEEHFRRPIGYEFIVRLAGASGVFEEDSTYYIHERLELVVTPKPHKHAALIKAWADGAQIQRFSKWAPKWEDVSIPGWNTECDYRIKPEVKPDRVETRWLAYNTEGKFMWGKETGTPNVKYTFDGETGKLKSVELINKD